MKYLKMGVFRINNSKPMDPSKKHIRLIAGISCLVILLILYALLHASGTQYAAAGKVPSPVHSFEQNLNSLLSTELGGSADSRHIYALQDSDMVAPAPNPDCFGTTDDPAEMSAVLKAAHSMLDMDTTLFTAETPIKAGSEINYYLDETIFAVSWKQSIGGCTYTFSEVKIAHPSQFRRFLSEGKYNSGILHTTTEMADSVNAVTASSGDYYSYRRFGIVVNEGVVYRDHGQLLDTCYIDSNGDLSFTYAREIDGKAAVQNYVAEKDIRFSLCFGPVMVVDGKNVVPETYNSGEINEDYPRAALCQLEELHYVMVCGNHEAPDYWLVTVSGFADILADMGIPTAYALDGGQTASIVFNDKLVNTVSYGSQREISDIIYFATAIPEEQ